MRDASCVFLYSSAPPPLLTSRRSRRPAISLTPTATASDDKSQNKNLDFITDRINDLRNLVSGPSLPSLDTLPALNTLPSLSSLQRLATISTFRALAPTPLDHLCPVPTHPSFNPILALNLATYAFRAYHDPPSSSYRETFTTPVGDSHTIQTDIVYPSTQEIAASATGLFLLKFSQLDGYIIARINHATVRDFNRVRHLSILRIDHPDHHHDDVLHLYFYPSDDLKAPMPSHIATLPLKSIVDTAFQTQRQAALPPTTITFDPIDYASQRIDFFQASLLPTELRLPFWCNDDQKYTLQSKNNQLKLTVEASFVPFTDQDLSDIRSDSDVAAMDKQENADLDEARGVSNAIEALGEAIQEAAEEQEEAEKALTFRERRRRDALAFILRRQLPKGKMPNPTDWSRLAAAASTLMNRIATVPGYMNTLDVNASPCLFVESHATDTEVWFFRDVRCKALVVSFRGTEQVSWRDFFTDAQMFLQRWMPGEDIDLTVSTGNTVGLAEFVPSIVGKAENGEAVADDVGAVHYGFLRAYLSVREAVDHSISLLTEGESDYDLLFTGHSLGGALATVAAGDYAARRGGKVCCMSFGAPKVGNFNFAKRFNELVPNAFRIVNDSDLVSRMPRSLSGGGAVDRYKHSGRTVLLNDFGDYWIEGENDGLLLDAASSITNPFRERYKDLKEMIQHEKQLWEQLLSGLSVKHHMEDSYFGAIQQVVRRVAETLEEESDEEMT